jgi:vancomycin resistance protein YoaR
MIKKKHKTPFRQIVLFFGTGVCFGLTVLAISYIFFFEKTHSTRLYPGIYLDGVNFGGQDKKFIEDYFAQKSKRFSALKVFFKYDNDTATISATKLNIAYNGKLIADQAYSLGRSNNPFSNITIKIIGLKSGIRLPVSISLNDTVLENIINEIAAKTDVRPQDALFKFQSGRVTAFRTSESGRKLNKESVKKDLYQKINNLAQNNDLLEPIVIKMPIEEVEPKIDVSSSNNFGIETLIGHGTSTFFHSIANRIFNIELASSRLNGILVPPGNTFSFNEALGDVSNLTGYKTAYIIKDGKTILGDGGGICQVSTTLFRAALNSGLPIIERWSHSYRVGYYEQDELPGLDATVYSPANDLKITNNTPAHILIQSDFDESKSRLTFKIYGKKDFRNITLTKPRLWDYKSPPESIYQDDQTLQKGSIVQIEYAAPGIKSAFDYKVERLGKVLFQKTFISDYQPWRAVYLRGTKE